VLNAFLDWLQPAHRQRSNAFRRSSFRANGNLLSQWRGYSVHGKGVSLGFDPATIVRLSPRPGLFRGPLYL
jgi:hypothetical protein